MRRIALTTLFLLLVVLIVPATDAAKADPLGKVETVAGAGGAGYNTSATISGTVGSIIKSALSLLGVVFLLLIVYGGFRWLTAAGNEESVESAKKIITQATIGLAITLSAYAITFFIVSRLEQATLLDNSPAADPGSIEGPQGGTGA